MGHVLVIFDLDGTLYDARPACVEATNLALAELGLSAQSPDSISALIGLPAVEFVHRLAPALDGPWSERLSERIRDHELRLLPERGLMFSGVADLLERLQSHGHRLAICSNGREEYIRAVLNTFRIGDRFTAVRGRKSGQDKGSSVGELIRDLGSTGSVVVGDRIHDLEAARANGLASIGVAYGYGGGEIQSADFLARDPQEIETHVERCQVLLEIASAILSLPRPAIVGITGVDTSGKTTFALDLDRRLRASGERPQRIHLDDFHNPAALRRQGPDQVNAYLTNAFDVKTLEAALLRPTKSGTLVDVDLRLLDLETDTHSVKRHYTIGRDSIVIVEGVLLFRDPLDQYLDLRIFLDIDFDEVLNRAARRDVPKLGPAVLERYVQRYIPAQKIYLQEHRPKDRADYVIESRDPIRIIRRPRA